MSTRYEMRCECDVCHKVERFTLAITSGLTQAAHAGWKLDAQPGETLCPEHRNDIEDLL